MARKQISPERKGLYHAGQVVGVLGFLCFLSTFLTAAMNFGDFTNFQERGRSMGTRAILGMVMMVAGNAMMSIGSKGLAGSGITLDPEEGRRDIEPWSRASGGVLKDVMEEAGIKLGKRPSSEELPFDERLRRLHKLRDEGLVSEEEFENTKRKILESA